MLFFNQDIINKFYASCNEPPSLHFYSFTTLVKMNKIKNLSSAVHSNCINISSTYIDNSLHKLNSNYRNNIDEYDLVLVTKTEITKDDSYNMVSNVLGFMIVQKGECKKYPNAYSLNLICTKADISGSVGSYLLALYVYTIANNNEVTSKVGLLELASAYLNMGGLCLYSKYGFEYDHSLYGYRCFKDINNLPMIVDLKNKYGLTETNVDEVSEKIINICTKNQQIFTKPEICYIRGDRQIILGILMNLKRFMDLNKPEYITSVINSKMTKIDYALLYEALGGDINVVDTKIQEINTLTDDEINIMLEYAVQLRNSSSRKRTYYSSDYDVDYDYDYDKPYQRQKQTSITGGYKNKKNKKTKRIKKRRTFRRCSLRKKISHTRTYKRRNRRV